MRIFGYGFVRLEVFQNRVLELVLPAFEVFSSISTGEAPCEDPLHVDFVQGLCIMSTLIG
jgi:hypothetical protein